MKGFRIIIDDSDVFQSKESFSDGQAQYIDMIIYIGLGKTYFPCKDWTDMADSVLFQWIENVLRNRGRDNTHYELFFMDGPYKIDVFQETSEVILRGTCFRGDNETVFEFKCSYKALVSELLSATKTLQNILKTNPLFSHHFENIVASTCHYEQLLRSAVNSL